MELENHKIVHQFITNEEKNEIISFVDTLNLQQQITNNHIKSVAAGLNGNVYMFDFTKTDISGALSNYQSSENVHEHQLPKLLTELKDRISETIGISKDHVFLQILDMNKGGKIVAHYDSAHHNYITYKCNISILAHDYELFIDATTLPITERDLYCFEASLFKHWTNEFNSRRILLSYGFILPMEELGRNGDDPRIRLSNRIVRHFQK